MERECVRIVNLLGQFFRVVAHVQVRENTLDRADLLRARRAPFRTDEFLEAHSANIGVLEEPVEVAQVAVSGKADILQGVGELVLERTEPAQCARHYLVNGEIPEAAPGMPA